MDKKSDSWKRLLDDAERLRSASIRQLFDAEPDRLDYLSMAGAGIYLDVSKNALDRTAFDNLHRLASDRAVTTAVNKLLSGEHVNITEDRPALHTLLRGNVDPLDSDALTERRREVERTLNRIDALCDALHQSNLTVSSGQSVRHVVNIGIGGSHLGPQLVVDALRNDHQPRVSVDFISNVDQADLNRVLDGVDAASTLFVVASKSFTTAETLLNMSSARRWLADNGVAETDSNEHFIAVTANVERAHAAGIEQARIFPMWDWVGGRYSLWSAIGLPIACAIGSDNFRRLLNGAHAMDTHFQATEPTRNLPIVLALVGVWNNNFLGIQAQSIVPYDDRLRYLPNYLQQLEMESNGKQTRLNGNPVEYTTSPIVWGDVGSNAQHAFFQLLHQGQLLSAVDLIAVMNNPQSRREHQDALIANCFAQSEALMCGRTLENLEQNDMDASVADLKRHRASPGNRPNTTIVVDELTPETLGALLALYEHKTYVQGVLWDINPFDQWGVELGKQLATSILAEFAEEQPATRDASTRRLIERYLRLRAPEDQ